MDSYPPHLLRLPDSAPGDPARGHAAGEPAPAVPEPAPAGSQQRGGLPTLLATPGEPGTYDPPVSPGDRPRNLPALRERVRPATPEPWPAGSFVVMGDRRRAHWNGATWKCKESPGYAVGELVAVRSEPEQSGV